jgi:hypothetical protein
MKILITEDQQSSIQEKLQKMVKKLGWNQTSKAVGGSENLKKLSGIKTPIDFLNLFNDLDVVQSEERPILTLFRYKKHNNLMVYNRESNDVFISYYGIWFVLESHFNLNRIEIKELTKEWLVEVYNLRGITTKLEFFIFQDSWLKFTI